MTLTGVAQWWEEFEKTPVIPPQTGLFQLYLLKKKKKGSVKIVKMGGQSGLIFFFFFLQ